METYLCPILKKNTHLQTELMKIELEEYVNEKDEDLKDRFLGVSNILLDDVNINKWMENYHLYWESESKVVEVKRNSKF